MSDGLPEIYWYAFWAVLFLAFIAWGFYAAITTHRRNMKALEILKLDAEKGADRPAAIADQLAKQILNSPQSAGAQRWDSSGRARRDALLQTFIGFLFCACIAWGLNSWLVASEGAAWAVYASGAAWAFFGFGAFGLLVAALLTREK